MGFSARRESFLVSIGQFLDKYHISSRAKDQARLLLVRGFVYLDSISIPDAPRATLAFLLRPRERIEMRFAIFLYLSSLVLIGLTLYWNFLSLPEFAIAIVLTISFLEALTPYIPWSAILQVAAYFGIFFLVPVVCFIAVRLSFRMLYDRKSKLLRFVSPIRAF